MLLIRVLILAWWVYWNHLIKLRRFYFSTCLKREVQTTGVGFLSLSPRSGCTPQGLNFSKQALDVALATMPLCCHWLTGRGVEKIPDSDSSSWPGTSSSSGTPSTTSPVSLVTRPLCFYIPPALPAYQPAPSSSCWLRRRTLICLYFQVSNFEPSKHHLTAEAVFNMLVYSGL